MSVGQARRASKGAGQKTHGRARRAPTRLSAHHNGDHEPASPFSLLKILRQAVRLSVFWVAICTSLAGMLTYTKSGLEVLLADVINAPPTKSQPARAQRGL